MTIPSPGRPPRLRQPFKGVALGASALLLALALACGAAEQPVEQAPQAGQASQSAPAQPAAQPQAASENAPAQQGSQEMTQDMAKADQPATGESGSQQADPTASREMAVEHPSTEPMAEAKMDQATEPQSELMVKAIDSQPASEPSTGPTEPMASHQDSMGDKNEEMAAPAAETAPQPAAEPQPAAKPEPATEPQATEAPAVVEPMAEVGNQVGNRIPDFTLDLVGGATVSTVSLVEEGKPTFLFFTSTT